MDDQELLACASERTGLGDFGDDEFREALRVLVRSLEGEARLHAEGRAELRRRLVDLLVNRLRVQSWLTQHPEVVAEPIAPPLVVVGFPRTGTTHLQRLLACDPGTAALAWWEARNPAPFPDWSPESARRTRDARIVEAEAQTRAMLERNPDLAAVHPFDALAPDEDCLLLEHSFRTTVPAALAHVPTYLRWHLARDMRTPYRELDRVLRFLQWQKQCRGERPRRWVLKAPEHLGYLDLIFERFPDATVIQTHRDPLETLPSFASMNVELRRMASHDVDPRETGAETRLWVGQWVQRSLAVRESAPAERFVDLSFRDVATKPLGAIEQIYRHLGEPLPAEVRGAMEAWLARNPRDARPPHTYSLAEFGHDAEDVCREFERYRELFVRPMGLAVH